MHIARHPHLPPPPPSSSDLASSCHCKLGNFLKKSFSIKQTFSMTPPCPAPCRRPLPPGHSGHGVQRCPGAGRPRRQQCQGSNRLFLGPCDEHSGGPGRYLGPPSQHRRGPAWAGGEEEEDGPQEARLLPCVFRTPAPGALQVTNGLTGTNYIKN